MDYLVEILSAQLHALYQHEARRQGDVRHPALYVDLPEPTKEFDRVLARFILKHCTAAQVQTMLADTLKD